MAFQPIDFSRAQGTADWSGLRDAVQSYYASKKGALESQLLPQKMMAETEMYKQHGNLYGAQIPGEIAKSQKQQLLNAIIAQMTGGAGFGGGASLDPNMLMQQPQNMQMAGMAPGQDFDMQQAGMPQGMMQGNMGSQGSLPGNALLAGILRKELGLEAPYHTLNADNELVTYDPLTGQVSRQTAGRALEETERAKTKGAKQEERIQELKTKSLAEYMAEDSKQPILDELMGIVNDPRFTQSTGKYQNIIQSIKPGANVQELKGQFNLYTGELVNRASSVFGSNLTQGMYNTMRKIKANESDEPMANKAKVLMANMLSRQNLQYQRAFYNNLEQNMDPITAAERARSSVDTREIKDLLFAENKAHQLSSKLKVNYEQVMRNAYKVANELKMPVSEVLNNFEKDMK